MFNVIDAKRLGSQNVLNLIGAEDRESAKKVLNSTLFYELELWKGHGRIEIADTEGETKKSRRRDEVQQAAKC